jgi:serine protease AprX
MSRAIPRRSLAGVALLAASVAMATPSTATASRNMVSVIVQGTHSAESTVVRLGGSITRQLPLIGGFSARVPAGDVPRIAQLPGVRYVSPDGAMHVQSVPTTSGSTGPNDVYKKVVKAAELKTAGYSGQGVTVALIDTGVTALPDVAPALVPVATVPGGPATSPCVNFSATTTCDDQYGHGTFLAGLIVGNGSASNGQYTGVAPAARLLSVKIAGADGSADISNVIAAIQWVVAFKDVYGIKVLNLSLGSNGTQSYMLSPLDFAVEKAWQAGITVVVSASNLGPAPSTIDKPADDPFVITVGAIDDQGSVGTNDDSVPNFSARGPTAADGLAKPDVVAPGAHLVSLAAPGATITNVYPSSMPAPYRRGSGTSMSTAVVSGLIADILSAQPSWSPDRVKFALMATARPDASTDPMSVGAGLVDGYDAAFNAPAGLADQGLTPGSGLGSIQADRGTVTIQAADGTGTVVASPLSGEVTAQLTPWDPASMLVPNFNGSSWYGSSWYGSSWYGSSWYGSSWYGSSWYGSSWYGSSWYGSSWYGSSWYGSSWYGSSWYGAWDQ